MGFGVGLLFHYAEETSKKRLGDLKVKHEALIEAQYSSIAANLPSSSASHAAEH